MSWSDYTHAKHFGSGIYRPYSDFIADVLLDLDNRIAADPIFVRGFQPFPGRDTILILGETVAIWAFSTSTHKQYPLLATFKWPEFWTADENALVHQLGLSTATASSVVRPDLLAHLVQSFSFSDPLILSIPAAFQPKPGSPEVEVRSESVKAAAEILWQYEYDRYQQALEMEKPKEVFLSHNSIDKQLVREVARTLSATGFAPWLDEDKMKAGANLERAIKSGFTTSCAAVFFVTPNFADDGFMATEIDYAIAEKRQKGDRFSIITLLLRGADGSFGVVPEMLRQYVWKQVEPVEVVRTIIESLPIRMDRVVWRE
jgi:hypothetical protein